MSRFTAVDPKILRMPERFPEKVEREWSPEAVEKDGGYLDTSEPLVASSIIVKLNIKARKGTKARWILDHIKERLDIPNRFWKGGIPEQYYITSIEVLERGETIE